jgi:hypothetical protein
MELKFLIKEIIVLKSRIAGESPEPMITATKFYM